MEKELLLDPKINETQETTECIIIEPILCQNLSETEVGFN